MPKAYTSDDFVELVSFSRSSGAIKNGVPTFSCMACQRAPIILAKHDASTFE
jgi:hypothetical protein